jgi:hypothetical protein
MPASSAICGISVTPRPLATIWARVCRLVPLKPALRRAPSSSQAASAWSRRQWPSSSSSRFSSAMLAAGHVARGIDEREPVLAEIHHLEVAQRIGQRQQRGVEFARVQPFQKPRRLVLAQIELQLREALPQARHGARQQEGPDGRDDAEMQRARQRIARLLGEVDQILDALQQAARAGGDASAERRRHDRTLGPLQKRRPQQLFQFLDAGAQGGLGDVAGRRRLPEMAAIDHRHEVAELSQGRDGLHRGI